MKYLNIVESPLSRFLFTNPKISWLWFLVRVYIGVEWLLAGWGKLGVVSWTGDQAGSALAGFANGALAKTAGAHPDVQVWYGFFLEKFVLPYAGFWSHLVVYGEILVGIALILGAFTGIAAFFGGFMNLNYLLAGAVSTNPILLIFGLFILLAWRVSGFLGLDYFILPFFGVPWENGKLYLNRKTT